MLDVDLSQGATARIAAFNANVTISHHSQLTFVIVVIPRAKRDSHGLNPSDSSLNH